jgi:DNA polymerase III sliding clamp (beta) subunit (PCNA family)
MNLEALRFTKGGVARKDFVPALQHFHIQNGRILGYNGNIALSSPIDINLSCRPKAAQFIKAIHTCRDPLVSIYMTKQNRLAIKSGGFIAYVDCVEESEFPDVKPSGEFIKLPGDMLETIYTLAPFIAEDASRSWARGILFRNKSAYATNNVIIVERFLRTQFPVEINIPEETIYEIIRIKEEPIKLQLDSNSVTFHFQGDRWLRSSLYDTKWPDVSPIFERPSNPIPFPDMFYIALEDLIAFLDDLHRVYFVGDRVATEPTVNETGASSMVPGMNLTGCYNMEQLKLLGPVADKIDFSTFPGPCLFTGHKLRGAIIGMQM